MKENKRNLSNSNWMCGDGDFWRFIIIIYSHISSYFLLDSNNRPLNYYFVSYIVLMILLIQSSSYTNFTPVLIIFFVLVDSLFCLLILFLIYFICKKNLSYIICWLHGFIFEFNWFSPFFRNRRSVNWNSNFSKK